MSESRKRRSRVQGGWAAPQNVRSDRDKPKPQAAPNWLSKNIDQKVEKQFVYEKPTEEIRQKPPDKVISKPGVYDISTEPSGLSRIRFFPVFFEPKDADALFDELYHELPWRQQSNMKDGETYLQPRLTAWYGDHPYSYAGATHPARTDWHPVLARIKAKLEEATGFTFNSMLANLYQDKWHPVLARIKAKLEEATGFTFNSMLANLYRDGHDSLAWHSDDEASLGPEPTIASLSFGDTRNFQMRKKPLSEENGDYTYQQHMEIPLSHGTLLIMEGASQADWQHRIPREYHDRSARINLTFRVIFGD